MGETREPEAADEISWLRSLLKIPRLELIPSSGLLELVGGIPPQLPLTITCLPASGMEAVVEMSEVIAAHGHRVVPHLAARSIAHRRQLKQIIDRTRAAGVTDVFVIGGDRSRPVGPYADALALLQDMNLLGHGFDEVGVACYPDFHPFLDQQRLTAALRAKQPFATYMVSQICFDAAEVARWLLHIRSSGISLPLYVSVPGVVDVAYLLRLSLKIGVGDSIRYLRKNTGMLAAFRSGASFVPDQLLHDLGHSLENHEREIAGIHLNTFNRIAATELWRADFVRPPAC